MSQVWPNKYSNQVCPFCMSKKVSPVALLRTPKNVWNLDLPEACIGRTGYLCDNCKRYHIERDRKSVIDRAEMRRDIKQLQEFLQGE